MLTSRALGCFVGAWGFLNGTVTNTTSGALVPEWHSVYPSGTAVWASSSHFAYIITANDVTEPEKRPRELSLPAQPTDPDSRWALVGKYSVAAGGSASFEDVCGRCNFDGSSKGASGTVHTTFATATLPSWVGYNLTQHFEFYEGGNLQLLRAQVGVDLVQNAWLYRLPYANGAGPVGVEEPGKGGHAY